MKRRPSVLADLPGAAGALVGGLARTVAVAGDVDVGQLGDGDD